MLHTPHFVVFYNGMENVPERMELRLSESFLQPMEMPELEVRCMMYNINPGFNTELLGKATAISGYMHLVSLVREHETEMNLEDVIHWAIDECIANGVLRDFLLSRRSEVEKAMTLDFSHERELELTARDEREAGREEGRKEGREEGRVEGREEGRKEGRVEGREEERQKCITTYISKSGASLAEALDFFDIVGEERNLYHA